MPKLTLEQEIELCNEYTNTKITEKELQTKYNICNLSIANIRKRHGVSRRPKIKNNLIACNEDYFETIDSADKSYWLGFISADARVDEDDNTLVINLAVKDQDHLEIFLMMIESEHHIRNKYTYLKNTGKTYKGCVVKICRPKIIADLVKHGITQNKSKELSIPKTIPDEFINAFLRGYIDGDGCISIDQDFRIGIGYLSSIKSFSEEIKNILIQKCNVSDNKIITKPGCFEIRWTKIDECKRIYDYLYSDNGPRLNRKYQIAKNYFDNLPNIKSRSKNLVKIKITENPKIPSELDRLLGFV